jgi:hypothetical protein
VAGLPPWWPGFEPRSDHVGIVIGKATLGQSFSEYFRFPCQFSFHRLLHTHRHQGLVQWPVGSGQRCKISAKMLKSVFLLVAGTGYDREGVLHLAVKVMRSCFIEENDVMELQIPP